MTDEFSFLDAAYVLGALGPQERRDYEQHLRTCEQCSAAVAKLAGLPGLLARVTRSEAEEIRDRGEIVPVPVPDTLLPRLQTAVRGRRRRRTVLQVAAAAVLAAACLVLGLIIASPLPPPGPDVTLAMASPEADLPVDATVSLRDVGWGTKLQIKCIYHSGSGAYPGSYRLLIVNQSGVKEQVASWKAVPGGATTTVDGATAVLRSQIRTIEVTADSGDVLLSATP